jgi:hypothetical protein
MRKFGFRQEGQGQGLMFKIGDKREISGSFYPFFGDGIIKITS